MPKTNGFSLAELLIALWLSSLIFTVILQLYITTKSQYQVINKRLSQEFEVRWVMDLISDSVRRAGFTPCMGIDSLKTTDRRNSSKGIPAIVLLSSPQPKIQVNRMSDNFVNVLKRINAYEILVSEDSAINSQRPIIIADCKHAEIHTISSVQQSTEGRVVVLNNPMLFAFDNKAYLGEWIEEEWLVKKNIRGISNLYYRMNRSEELSSLVHGMTLNEYWKASKRIVRVRLFGENKETYSFQVVVRNS